MKLSSALLSAALVIGHCSLVIPCASAQEIPPILPPGLNLPAVRLLSLGGTISGTAKDRLNVTNYGAPRLSPEDWVNALPDLALFAEVTPEDIRPAEPATVDEAHWMKVAKRLQEIATDDSIEGVVITHGTNTMVETGYFLSLVVNIKKPVVMVGAQRPWTGMSGDGPLNMVNAVRVAATPEATGKGVLHAMNQNVFPIRDVTKTSAYRVHTFQGIDLGVIGVADPDIVKFYAEPTRLHTFKSEFNIASLPATLPDVEILYGYNGTPGYVVDAMVANGVKGIVVDGTGAGSVPETANSAVKRAQEKASSSSPPRAPAAVASRKPRAAPRPRSSPAITSRPKKPASSSSSRSPRPRTSPRSNVSSTSIDRAGSAGGPPAMGAASRRVRRLRSAPPKHRSLTHTRSPALLADESSLPLLER